MPESSSASRTAAEAQRHRPATHAAGPLAATYALFVEIDYLAGYLHGVPEGSKRVMRRTPLTPFRGGFPKLLRGRLHWD